MRQRLPCKAFLAHRGLLSTNLVSCDVCDAKEDIEHILIACLMATETWNLISTKNALHLSFDSVRALLASFSNGFNEIQQQLLPIICGYGGVLEIPGYPSIMLSLLILQITPSNWRKSFMTLSATLGSWATCLFSSSRFPILDFLFLYWYTGFPLPKCCGKFILLVR